MRNRRLVAAVGGALASVTVAACAEAGTPQAARSSADPPSSVSTRTTDAPSPPPSSQPSSSEPSSSRPSSRAVRSEVRRRAPEPRRSHLSIPVIGLRSFPVVRYRGRPDDAPGTEIQNSGPMASPRGPRGGVGPGQVGNFIVTGHRTSHTMPFAELPSLRAGDRVRVRSGRQVHVYRVTRTRWTSFRQPESRAAQEAPVPGRPGVEPVRPMITLSTCATPEDHANGNYWADRFGNPEHRIDKIGVLVRTTER